MWGCGRVGGGESECQWDFLSSEEGLLNEILFACFLQDKTKMLQSHTFQFRILVVGRELFGQSGANFLEEVIVSKSCEMKHPMPSHSLCACVNVLCVCVCVATSSKRIPHSIRRHLPAS